MVSPSSRTAPLVVTATLPPDMQARFDRLRRAHFPAERNWIAAHVTLFHSLPPQVEAEARDLLSRMASATPPINAQVRQVMDLGTGTAFLIESPAMSALRDAIVQHFHGMLTLQDSHRPRLHVTVQNKVSQGEARALQKLLTSNFEPSRFAFAGLALHRYLGGPWEAIGRWPFRAAPQHRLKRTRTVT